LLNRRSFLRGIGALAGLLGSAPFLSKAEPLIPIVKKDMSKKDMCLVLSKIIKGELAKYPRGHVARSIKELEVGPAFEEFGYDITAVSVGRLGSKDKYFAVVVDPKPLLSDLKFRDSFIKDMLQLIRRTWIQSNRSWGIA